MVAVALASVIVAVISLVGAICAAAVAAYIAYWSDKRKHHAEAVAILNKYRDPLLLSAVALRHKLMRFFPERSEDRRRNESSRHRGYHESSRAPRQEKLKSSRGGGYKQSGRAGEYTRNAYDEGPRVLIYDDDPRGNDVNSYFVTHTAFLVGQFFAWVHILRLESQFLNIQRTDQTSSLTNAFFDIEKAWSNQDVESSYMLWRGQQSAIGELMTITAADGQHSCMGYAAFHRCWASDGPNFRSWFEAFDSLAADEQSRGSKRMTEVNNGLHKLIKALDSPKGLFSANYSKLEEGVF